MRKMTTKELIMESFLELSAKKRIDRITIANITDNCGLSHPTFYNHFKDKYDLIVRIYVEGAGKILRRLGTEDCEWKILRMNLAEYFIANRGFVINALTHTGGQDSFIRNVERIHADILSKTVREKLKSDAISPELDGIIKVYCYGTVHFLFEWLTDGKDMTPEAIAGIWEKSCPDVLRPFLEP